MYNYTQLDPVKCDFVPIAPAGDVPEGSRLFVEIDGRPIVVLNVAGQLFAIADVCSHDDGPLGDGEVEGADASQPEIVCPRHGAHFDLRSGKATALPAVVDVPAYPVRVQAGQIEIGVPLEE